MLFWGVIFFSFSQPVKYVVHMYVYSEKAVWNSVTEFQSIQQFLLQLDIVS